MIDYLFSGEFDKGFVIEHVILVIKTLYLRACLLPSTNGHVKIKDHQVKQETRVV